MKLQTLDPQAKYNIVDIPALEKRIKLALSNHDLNRLLIYGGPGLGKTAILTSIIPEGYKLIVKTLSNETPDNFMLPKYVTVNGEDKATDIPKTWLPVYLPTGDPEMDKALDEKCGKGLLFIDELSRATQQVLNVILPLLNEGTFNGYKLGSGWTIIAASNRPEDDMCGQSDLGNALVNRFSILYFEPKADSWAKWATTQSYISPVLINWLKMGSNESMSGGKYFYWDPNEESNAESTKLMCTPRSWTNASRVLSAYTGINDMSGTSIFHIDKSILKLAFNECVPKEAVDAFISYCNILSQVTNLDELCESVWAGKGKVIDKKKLLKLSLPLAQIIITSHSKKYPSKEEMTNFANWLVLNDSDQFCTYCLDIIEDVFAPQLNKYSRENIFVLNKCYKEASDEDKNIYKSLFKPFLEAWGFTCETMPDWSDSVDILLDKYGDIIQNSIVDGKSAFNAD